MIPVVIHTWPLPQLMFGLIEGNVWRMFYNVPFHKVNFFVDWLQLVLASPSESKVSTAI